MLECVLLDREGVLVDSEPLQFRTYQGAFARDGVAIAITDWRRWLSTWAPNCW